MPFLCSYKKTGYYCKYLSECPAFDHFKLFDFEKFDEFSHTYCLSPENNENCARFKKRESGEKPEPKLMPDGSFLEEGA